LLHWIGRALASLAFALAESRLIAFSCMAVGAGLGGLGRGGSVSRQQLGGSGGLGVVCGCRWGRPGDVRKRSNLVLERSYVLFPLREDTLRLCEHAQRGAELFLCGLAAPLVAVGVGGHARFLHVAPSAARRPGGRTFWDQLGGPRSGDTATAFGSQRPVLLSIPLLPAPALLVLVVLATHAQPCPARPPNLSLCLGFPASRRIGVILESSRSSRS